MLCKRMLEDFVDTYAESHETLNVPLVEVFCGKNFSIGSCFVLDENFAKFNFANKTFYYYMVGGARMSARAILRKLFLFGYFPSLPFIL